MEINWSASTGGIDSHFPLGQRTSIAAFVSFPRPKWSRGSLQERKLDWLCNSCVRVLLPALTTTRAPMALRLEALPKSFTFSQWLLPDISFRSKDGGSFRLTINI